MEKSREAAAKTGSHLILKGLGYAKEFGFNIFGPFHL